MPDIPDTHGYPLDDDDLISHATGDFPHGANQSRSPNAGCECPFPWLLLLLGTAVGGGVGYYVGRRSGQTEDDGDTLELGPGR